MSNIYACEFLSSPLLSGDGSRVQCLCWEGVARWISLCNRMFTRLLGKGTGSWLNEDTRKGWYIYWSSDTWEQNTLSRACQIFLKVSSQCQWHILGRGAVLEGCWCKPHCGNDFFSPSFPCNLFANCMTRVRDVKERIRGISKKNPLPYWAIEYCLLDKELLVLHCFPLASVLLHTSAKTCLITLKKLPCSSNISPLYSTYF